MTHVRIGSALRRAVQQVAQNVLDKHSGLYLPPDVIAAQHYGREGYTPWVAACIRAACESVHGVGPDELSELTAFAMWQPDKVELVVEKHSAVMGMVEQFANRIADMTQKSGLTEKFTTQVIEAHKTRGLGTILVIAMNPVQAEKTGELNASMSCWNPATVEQALVVAEETANRKYRAG